MAEEELEKRVAKLEKAWRETQAEVGDRRLRQLEAVAVEKETELKVLRDQVAVLTSDKQQLLQQIAGLKSPAVAVTPTRLIQSFRGAMDQLQTTLEPKPGDRVGYTVNQFDVNMKAAVKVDPEADAVGFVFPEPDRVLPAGQLSDLRFTLAQVPKVEIPDHQLVEVPMLLGLELPKALAALNDLGLDPGQVSQRLSTAAPGTVIDQEPDAGDLVPSDAAIDLTVAQDTTKIEVPSVIDLSLDEAVAALKEADLAVGSVTEQISSGRVGSVLAQNPSAGTPVAPATPVDLVIAVARLLQVPDLRDKTLAVAKAELDASELQPGRITFRAHRVLDGVVLDQNPAAATAVPPGTAVDLTVARRRVINVEVPSLVDRKLAEARKLLVNSRLEVGEITQQLHRTLKDVVLAQTPRAGTRAPVGSAVDLTVARKRPRVEDFTEIVRQITEHQDFAGLRISPKVFGNRLASAGIETSKQLAALDSLSDKEVQQRLKLRSQVAAKKLKEIQREVLKGGA